MTDFEVIDRLVRQVYAAGLDRQRWKDVLAGISDAVGHVCLALNAHDGTANANIGFLAHNYDPDFCESYRRYYAGINPWNQQVVRQPIGRAVRSQHVLAPDLLRTTEFYNGWIAPQEDVGTGAGLTLFRSTRRFVRLSANIRFRDQERMQETLVTVLNRLAPHMMAAFDLVRSVSEPLRVGLEIAIGNLADAAFVLDSLGRVCLMNASAQQLQSQGGVLTLDASGVVVAADRVAQTTLSGWLQAQLLGQIGALRDLTLRNSDGESVAVVSGFPLVTGAEHLALPPSALESGAPAFILIVREAPDRSPRDSRIALRQYGFSPAERELAQLLARGQSITEIATLRGTAVSTVRSQLKTIMSKTGTHRQAELVSHLLRMGV